MYPKVYISNMHSRGIVYIQVIFCYTFWKRP